jgi:flagellar motor switch protein FliN
MSDSQDAKDPPGKDAAPYNPTAKDPVTQEPGAPSRTAESEILTVREQAEAAPTGDEEDPWAADLAAQAALDADTASAHEAAVSAAPARPGLGGAPANRDSAEVLLDVELEATLRFGSREMTLGEVLELGPGDVIELDRQVSDAVELLVGDKIVARGVAVLCNGKYGLRVTEVAELKLTLESVRCLF